MRERQRRRALFALRRRSTGFWAVKYGLKKQPSWLKPALCGVLALEVFWGSARYWQDSGMTVQMYRREEQVQIDWIVPQAGAKGAEEHFGVRVRPDTWEIQFYHRVEKLGPPVQ